MQLLLNEAIYRTVIVELLPQTQKILWIVTADIKDLHISKGLREFPQTSPTLSQSASACA
jgi:hypothetical protein